MKIYPYNEIWIHLTKTESGHTIAWKTYNACRAWLAIECLSEYSVNLQETFVNMTKEQYMIFKLKFL
jgi:hypothetical protein